MRTSAWLVLAFIEAVAFAPAARAQEVVTAGKVLSAPGTVIEAESLAQKAKVSAGPVTVQNMQPFGVQWGGGAQLFWRPPAPVDKPIRNWPHLTTSLSAPADGEYSIVLYYTVAPDFGNFRVFLNGEPVKDVNGFAPAVGLRKLELAKTHLKAGSQQLVFTVFSKEPSAANYFVGLDRFEVRRVQAATGTAASAQSAFADALSTETGIDRPGADYRSVDLDVADPAICRSACEQDQQCKAYTFVRAGVQGPTARCYLKNAVPDAVANACCTSGVKPAALASSSRLPPTATFRQAREGASQAVSGDQPAGTIVSAVKTLSAGTKAEKPGPLGRGEAEGSINGKTALPACPTGGAPKAVLEVLGLLDNIAGTFGASVSKSYYCGAYKREIATGVTLAPPQPPPGKKPTWGQLGGRGDLMADAMLCLMKDIGDLPGGKFTRSVSVPVAVGKVELKQTVGLSKFDAASRRAELYQVTRICVPLLGCLDAQRQNIVATVRESAPAWPGGQKPADYPIANSYSMELASDWGATTLAAKLPKITFATPYGQVSAQPGFSYATNLLPIDTPFAFQGSAGHPFHYPKAWGTASPILQDTYGRSGTPFILNVAANLPQPQPGGAPKPRGWVSQIGFGGRDGAWDAQVWAPAAGEKYPERRDYDMTRARSAFERAPAANFVAQAPIRFEPPNPKSLLPGPVQDVISGVELWIEVTPAFTADYAAQLAFLAREGVMVNACSSGKEFGDSCGLAETALVAQANAQGHVQITGKVHLLISFGLPFVDDIKIDEPFLNVGWPLGRKWDPSPAIDGVQRAHDVAAWAGNAAYSGPGDVRWQSAHGFSGMAAPDLHQWTEQCLKTPPKTVSTMPEPTHEPGKPDDLKPELLPCNICVTDKGQGKFAPFKLFEVTSSAPGVKALGCWAGREGCYDLCSWDQATATWQSVEKSAADIIGPRCVQPQVK